MNKNINILGIKVSTEPKEEILQKISNFLNTAQKHYIVTPNPEFLLLAAKDEEFFYILNQAELAIPDGIGLSWAGFFSGHWFKRISGIDLMQNVCQIAMQKNKSIFLLGGSKGVAKEAKLRLQKKYPGLSIVGAESGLENNQWEIKDGLWIAGQKLNKQLVERINQVRPDIIFVAFGHVKQEKWIYHNLPDLINVKMAMGVGGSFDFISERIKRAPLFFRNLGLEWLWRLIQEPQKRLPRIFNAVVKFPLAFCHWRFIQPCFYRKNVACLLYKKEDGKIYVLLAERRSEANHWQLPQGGTDGQNLITAGTRELREEIGTDKFRPKAALKNLYAYSFTEEMSASSLFTRKNGGYKGQKQGLFIAEFIGSDNDIIINYWDHRDWRWVELDNVVNSVHKIRQKATIIFINKFKKLIKEDL